jgi:hypothetical protein
MIIKRETMKAEEPIKPTDLIVAPQEEPALGGGLFKIVVASTALALGCMAAALQSLRRGASGFAFQFSFGTFVAFAVGLAAGILYWKLASRNLFGARLGNTLLVLAGVGAFLYPLRFVRADKVSDIAIGLGAATCAISLVGLLLLKMKRFFEADTAAEETKKIH